MIASWTVDMWSPIINLFSFIPSYGFMIIVFTIALKLVLSPLDVWQRKVSRDSMIKQQKMQPELEKIKKACGNNQQLLNQKTMQLYKKNGYNVFGSCFSMLLNMALTLFIFITLFTALMGISQEKIYNQYKNLDQTYQETIVTQLQSKDTTITDYEKAQTYIDNLIQNRYEEAKVIVGAAPETTDEQKLAEYELKVKQKAFEIVAEKDINSEILACQDAIFNKYEEIKDNWLWIDSIWRPDTYVAGFPKYSEFYNLSNLKNNVTENTEITRIAINYDVITAKIQKNYSSWNGYFILVILAALVTYLSVVISQLTTSAKKKTFVPVNNSVKQINPNVKQVDPQKSMSIMKFIMPIIMIIFTLSYSAAFALYIVTNSIMATIISFVALKIFDKLDKNKAEKEKTKKVVEYSR